MTVTQCHRFLVDEMYNECEMLGASASPEYAVHTEDSVGFIDVAAWDEAMFLAIEIERSSRRIEADIDKAIAVQADELIIVVPNPYVKRYVKKRIQQRMPHKSMEIFVGCLPEALKRLRHFFPFK